MYQAFGVIEEMGGVSPSLFMGGLKVSMIPTFYGITIYLLSLLLWFIFDFIATQNQNNIFFTFGIWKKVGRGKTPA